MLLVLKATVYSITNNQIISSTVAERPSILSRQDQSVSQPFPHNHWLIDWLTPGCQIICIGKHSLQSLQFFALLGFIALPFWHSPQSWKPKKDIEWTYIPGDICMSAQRPHNISQGIYVFFMRCCADIVWTLCGNCAIIVRTYISRDICLHYILLRFSPQLPSEWKALLYLTLCQNVGHMPEKLFLPFCTVGCQDIWVDFDQWEPILWRAKSA